jgi:hypothetical protein
MPADDISRITESMWIQVAAHVVRGALDTPGSVPADEAHAWLDALTDAALEQRGVED